MATAAAADIPRPSPSSAPACLLQLRSYITYTPHVSGQVFGLIVLASPHPHSWPQTAAQ